MGNPPVQDSSAIKMIAHLACEGRQLFLQRGPPHVQLMLSLGWRIQLFAVAMPIASKRDCGYESALQFTPSAESRRFGSPAVWRRAVEKIRAPSNRVAKPNLTARIARPGRPMAPKLQRSVPRSGDPVGTTFGAKLLSNSCVMNMHQPPRPACAPS